MRWDRLALTPSLVSLVSSEHLRLASQKPHRHSVPSQVPSVVRLEQLSIAVVLEHAGEDEERTFQVGETDVMTAGSCNDCQLAMQGCGVSQQNLINMLPLYTLLWMIGYTRHLTFCKPVTQGLH